MRVLLDESLPRQLARELVGHSVRTVRQQGWASLRNGELLQQARSEAFDIFVTADQNLEFQQNFARVEIAVIVMIARTNRIQDLLPLVPDLLQAIANIKRGDLKHIGSL